MGSEERVSWVECSGTKTPPRLCYHALPSYNQRAAGEPLGMATPPPQAPGSVPFRWEVAPGKPRGGAVAVDGGPVVSAACRRLEPPPRMALLPSTPPSTAWQVTKVADADVGEVDSKTLLGGPYYVLLRPPPSLFDGPSVVSRSNSLSSASFGRRRHHPVGAAEGKRRKGSPTAAWFWKWPAGRGEGVVSSVRKKQVDAAATAVADDGDAAALNADASGGGGNCGCEEAAAAAANVRITRFRRNGSVPNLSAGAGNHLWAGIYGGLKQIVTAAPWKSSSTRKSASRR